MAKAQKCTLIVNGKWGYNFTPIGCNSIAEAYRTGKDYPGFAFRIFVDGKVVKRGFCD